MRTEAKKLALRKHIQHPEIVDDHSSGIASVIVKISQLVHDFAKVAARNPGSDVSKLASPFQRHHVGRFQGVKRGYLPRTEFGAESHSVTIATQGGREFLHGLDVHRVLHGSGLPGEAKRGL